MRRAGGNAGLGPQQAAWNHASEDAFSQQVEAVAQLQRENAELRSRVQQTQATQGASLDNNYPSELDGFSVDDVVELAGSSVFHDGNVGGGEMYELAEHETEGEGMSRDAIFQRLQRERIVLLCDLNSVKAKFGLTLQTLRATLRLGAGASWADLLQHVEALSQGRGGAAAGQGVIDDAVAAAEAEEAELEREVMEDKLEEQQAHISRLRQLLQKQQKLLDMTANQIQDQHQQSKAQAEQVVDLEQQRQSQQEISDAQVAKIEALTTHNDRLKEELKIQRDHAARLEEQLRIEVQQRDEVLCREEAHMKREADKNHHVMEIKDQLARKEVEWKRLRQDCERQKQVIKELTDGLATSNAANDDMRDRLDVHEAEHRRQHSYQARTPDRGLQSSNHSLSNGSIDGYPAPGTLGALAVRGGQNLMDDEERNAFLSHFPMAQRTERAMRKGLDVERISARRRTGRN